MRGFALAAPALLALLVLPACNRKDSEVAQPDVQKGIDRSVADVRAAQAAASAPVVVTQSVGDLTRKADAADARAKESGKAGA